MAEMLSFQRSLICILFLHVFGWGVAMPAPELRYRYENDLTQFVNSLRGFVGEVSGVLSRPEYYEAFSHLARTGFGYLDSINIMNNHMVIFLDEQNAAQILNIQEMLRRLVTLLEIAANMADSANDDEQHADETIIVGRPVGRQRIPISQSQIELLHGMGFSWVQMANVLGVSARTVRNRRHEYNMPFGNNIYSQITDAELDEVITNVLQTAPRAGQSMILGAIRHRRIQVQRHRVRDSILRVNPVSTALRRRYRINRRIYSVGRPNALWHVDGNHKLISWRFVIHGGIDGYSRTVVFLHCADNNRAPTVLQGFRGGIDMFGLPQRLRIDYGTENYDIARYMLEQRGLGRGSVITGRSVHNQCIERLWRDVNSAVLSSFRETFLFMENRGLLNRDSELHIFSLHFVYLPRINRALQHFAEAWNNHRLRTEGQSPLQLFYSGVLVNDIDIDEGDLAMYGVDEEGMPGEMQTNNHVCVPNVNVNISEADMNYLQTSFDVLANDNNNGITIFMQVLGFVSAQL